MVAAVLLMLHTAATLRAAIPVWAISIFRTPITAVELQLPRRLICGVATVIPTTAATAAHSSVAGAALADSAVDVEAAEADY